MCHEQKDVGNGIVGQGQGLGSSEEDESRVDDVAANVNNGAPGPTEVLDRLQIPQQQPQGSLIRWERFLPIRSLKVLLVENDDSTRNVVSALLRNCSYEVTAVADGLQAWKALEDLNNRIDIVLTEVVMPVLSGIGLLCKIMSHKSFKNIPVIMMSSHDSMGLVFKCLSKGAVDFLVKPIRKNELKNLWQHVWRRCHSSSGSGSESGTQTKKSTKSKTYDESENDTGSSEEHDNGSDGLIARDGSDNGSGTQSSWTKRVAEVESSQPISPSNQLPDAPDSICAQVIHAKPERQDSQWESVSETKDGQKQDEQIDDAVVAKDLEIRIKGNLELQDEHQCKDLSIHQTNIEQNGLSEADAEQFGSGHMEYMKEKISSKDQIPIIITEVANGMCQQAESRGFDGKSGPSDISHVKEAYCGAGEVPSLENTLKSLQGAGDGRNTTKDDHNVLRHSDSSAFSKYNTASSSNQAPTGNIGSCSPLDNSCAMKTETTNNFPSYSNGVLFNQQSNGSSNNNDMTSTAKYTTPKPEALNEKSESISAFKPFHSSAFQHVQNGHISSSHLELPEKPDEMGVIVHATIRDSNQPFPVKHHHYNRQVERTQQKSLLDHDTSLENMGATAPQCGSSNMFEGPTECNYFTYSLNGSASCSNHGSNGPNGSSNAVNAEQTNVESENGGAGNNGAGAISGRISVSGADEDRIAQREAALTKFRQKRKERCFEKRVRYYSRKKLAEKRPRFKGQFGRRIVSDSEGGKDCSSSSVASRGNSCDSLR